MSPSSPGSPLRLGVVGAGRFATFLTGAVADLPDVAVHVVADQDAEAAALLAKAYDARVAASWQELLDDPTVDVVVVATPPASHGEIAREALWCGKHVFCEKPLATTTGDLDALVVAATA